MAKLSIDEFDLSTSLLTIVRETAAKAGEEQAVRIITEYEKKMSYPRFMNYSQAAKYMNTSYNTLKHTFIEKRGLKVILIDGYIRIDQRDVDAILEQNKQ